jgi:NTP pyrophosphatase (non-canonical NTP hydrolase)
MNRREHLYTILQEECAEIIQCVSKIKRFGLTNTQPASGKLNLEILNDEVNDLVAMLHMLEQDGVPIVINSAKIDAKKAKVEKYLEISKKAGTLK